MNFSSFPKIEHLNDLVMVITQKIHGTNAQIFIEEAASESLDQGLVLVEEKKYLVRAGSRTKWITPEDDNYGFASWVEANKVSLVKYLGPGQHFGEWAGPKINSGEGLTKKTLVLFDHYRYEKEGLPPDTVLVPVLYSGAYSAEVIERVMQELKSNGSVRVPGFMRPEGIVVKFAGKRFKKVFHPEETAWKKPRKKSSEQTPKEKVDYNYLCQPIRLEKLLSRDEKYLREWPKSMGGLVKDYIQDLVDEKQIAGDDDQIKVIRKDCTSQVFIFIKESVRKN